MIQVLSYANLNIRNLSYYKKMSMFIEKDFYESI